MTPTMPLPLWWDLYGVQVLFALLSVAVAMAVFVPPFVYAAHRGRPDWQLVAFLGGVPAGLTIGVITADTVAVALGFDTSTWWA